MQKAFFSHICSEIVPYIDNAQSSIKVAMAWFTSQELFRHLLCAIRKGINVELILMDDVINRTGYAPDFNNYMRVGGKMRVAIKSPGLMHNKFCIIDDEFVITGSYNWTNYAENLNKENIIIIDDAEIIRSYNNEYAKLWNSAEEIDSFDHYSNDYILDMDDVDYYTLNEEIKFTCKTSPNLKPFTFQPNTTIIDDKKKYLTKGEICVVKINGEGKEECEPLMNKGTLLPATSRSYSGYYDNTKGGSLNVAFFSIDTTNSQESFIDKFDFSAITTGVRSENLKISIRFDVEESGILTFYAKCDETGKTLKYTCIKRNLVRADD